MPQANWYRRHLASPAAPKPAPVGHKDRVQPRALAPAERQAILDVLHSVRFADLAPDEVWAVLLDEGTYLGSVSTCYRVLREAGESRERRLVMWCWRRRHRGLRVLGCRARSSAAGFR